MSEVLAGIIGLVFLLILFAAGIEMGFAMMMVGFVGFTYTNSIHAAMNLLARDLLEVASNYGFTVFPLFMLMGQLGFNAGIASRLYETAYKWIGHIPGGLAMATVGGATGFGSICGSSSSTAATFASVAVPQMRRFGYGWSLSTGIVSIAGTLGSMIPPSVVLILYGLITEQSIGQLFIAGVIPGLIIAVFFIGVIYGWARVDPKIAPRADPSTWKQRWSSLSSIIWVAGIFLVVVGGIVKGYFTPTEGGAVGAFTVLVVALMKRDMTIKKYIISMRQTLHTTGMIIMLLTGSMAIGHFITATNIPQIAGEWIAGLPLNRYIIMVLILLVYQIGGSFLEDLAFMILATPIFYPAVLKLGFDPIWFGIIMTLSQMIGVVIPPVAVCVFVVQNATRVPFGVIYKGVFPFLFCLIAVGILLFVFPQIALWLPTFLYK